MKLDGYTAAGLVTGVGMGLAAIVGGIPMHWPSFGFGALAWFLVGFAATVLSYWWRDRRPAHRLDASIRAGRLLDVAVGAPPVPDDPSRWPDPPAADAREVDADPTTWSPVIQYVDRFAVFVQRCRETLEDAAIVNGVLSAEAREAIRRSPRQAGVTDAYRYRAEPPVYVGHAEVSQWLRQFDAIAVQGFASDPTYTFDDVDQDFKALRRELVEICDRVGPPARRTDVARLQGQINVLKGDVAQAAKDRQSVSEIRSTFGPGSFGGDPQPGSGPLG